tara:strand:- start:14289 stop:14444 length:156 start_codon:yes stop_codon:yes gene_type:complete
MAVAFYRPDKLLSKEVKLQIAADRRNSGVLAIVHGVTVTRIRNIKRNINSK